MRKDRVLINNVETTGQPCGEKKDLFLISDFRAKSKWSRDLKVFKNK